MTKDSHDRSAIRKLLPWYAAGTLSDSERKRVEDAVRMSVELRAELRLIQSEQSALRSATGNEPVPSERLQARLSSAMAHLPRKQSGLQDRFNTWLAALGRFVAAREPRTLGGGVVVASLVLFLLAGTALRSTMFDQGPGYAPASSDSPQTTAGRFAIVAFRPEVPFGTIAELLASTNSTLAGGPFNDGTFRLRLGDANMSEQAMKESVARLTAAKSIVTMAVPAD